MEKVIEVLNRMQADGIVKKFAIGGGIAAIYYLEAYQTDDIDVFIWPVLVKESGLVSFGSIYSYLESLGYHPVKDSILVEDWLVQFLPASESIQEEAVAAAKRVAYGETRTFIFSPEHLAAELLRSGRNKDHIRVLALLESGKMDLNLFRDIVRRHGLVEKWNAFAHRFDLEK
jgi:hypothetical protein